MIPKIYSHVEEVEIFKGPAGVVSGSNAYWYSPNVTFADDEVGMFAFDYAIQAGVTSAGEITQAEVALLTYDDATNIDTEMQRIRGSRTWTRVFLPVDTGKKACGVASNGSFRSTDKISVRRVFMHRYRESSYIQAIDQLKPPKPLSGIQVADTLEGAMRMQRTGNTGCEIEMTLCFISMTKYKLFMKNRHDSYMVLKCRYGTYGGYLDGSATESEAKGSSVFVRVKLISPQRAGVGVDGI